MTRNAVAVVAGVFALLLDVWTVAPAPNLPLLIPAVIVPEIAPWGAIVALLALAVSLRWGRGVARLAGLAFGSAALVCALLPLAELPGTIAASDAAMRAALGNAADDGPRFDLHRFFFGRKLDPRVRVTHDLPVLTRDGTRLALDLYRAPGAGPHPAVVVIYGGGWRGGLRSDTASEDRRLAALGYDAIAIEYRLAPQYRFPVELDDVDDALATIARNARAWGVDPRRVALLGRSAGGELALLAAYRRQPLTIRAVVAYYPPVDLRGGYLEPRLFDPGHIRMLVRDYLGGPPDAAPGAYRAASPIDAVRAGLPPTFVVGGARDQLVSLRFQRDFRDALRAHGDTVVALEFPWSNHAFDEIPYGLGGQLARNYVAQFLTATL